MECQHCMPAYSWKCMWHMLSGPIEAYARLAPSSSVLCLIESFLVEWVRSHMKMVNC
jgi:hypothetical protein